MRTSPVVDHDALESAPPSAFGRFEVREEIGRGGMGVVYRAWDPELRRDVAVKWLHVRGLGRADAADLEARLGREARAMAGLSHPNLLPIFDVGRVEGDLFLAVEYVEGVTLRTWLEEPRAWREILALFSAAGQGLAAAHAARLVHRDFKPSNVLVGTDGRVRVADFGLARLVDERGGSFVTPHSSGESPDSCSGGSRSTQITRVGEVVGTPRYMAPEQYAGEDVGAATDQYAFCVALFEALVGCAPFDADGRELVRAKLALQLVPFAHVDVPAAVMRAVIRGLAPRPHDRFARIVDLLRVLDDARAGRRGRIVPLSGVAALAVVAAVAWGAAPSHFAAPPSCVASIDETWSAVRRGEVEEALRADPAPFAASVAARTTARLDAWAAHWAAASEETCTDASLAADVRAARLRCLEDGRHAMQAVVAALARGEVPLGSAVQTTARLPRPATCNRNAVALGWPTDSQRASEVVAIRADLADAKAQLEAGEYAVVIATLAALVVRAEAVDHPTTLASALHYLGVAQQRNGELGLARATLERAYFLAREHHDDDGAADSLAWLVYLVAYQDRAPEAARQWVPLAEREVERESLPPETRTSLLSHLGSHYQDIGTYERAIATWERAIEVIERELDGDPIKLAPLLNNLGNAWSDSGDNERALEYGLRSLAAKDEAFGHEHPSLGYNLNNLGLTYTALGRHDDALAALERALAIRIAAHGENHVDVGVSLANLGTTHRTHGDLDLAEPHLERALDVRERVLPRGHADIGLSLHSLADLHAARGEHERARAGFVAALDVLEPALGPDHPQLAYPLSGLGRCLLALDRPAEAVTQLERALAIRSGARLDPVEIANTSEALARALWAEGRDRSRAFAIAETARLGLATTGERGATHRRDLDTWLAAHPVAAPR